MATVLALESALSHSLPRWLDADRDTKLKRNAYKDQNDDESWSMQLSAYY